MKEVRRKFKLKKLRKSPVRKVKRKPTRKTGRGHPTKEAKRTTGSLPSK